MTAGLAALAVAAPAQAATYNVTGFGDSGGVCDGTSCPTLRAALTEAARQSGPDTITMPKGSYFAANTLPLSSEVTIIGESAATTTLQGDGKTYRVFTDNTTAKVTIQHLTIG